MSTEPYRAYFFAAINHAEGAPAPDWKAVLESLPAKGFGVNPRPDEKQPQDAPHHGITIMVDAGNNARGRIWLPTDLPQIDHNGNHWFTHEIQVIADGSTPGSFVWAWKDLGGPPVRPFSEAHVPPGPEPPPPPTPEPDTVLAALAELRQQLTSLAGAVEALKARPWPTYEGRIGSGWASTSVTLTPKP